MFIKDIPWLPDVHNLYVQTNSEAFINQKVSSLMITGDRQWDMDLISDLFNDRDADLIFCIPLGEAVEDNWYWRHEKLGVYLVKSVYAILQSAKRELAGAMGIREALSWVKKEQQKNVVIETDCLAVVQWIRNSFVTLSYLGRLVNECRQLFIGLQDQNVMLRFVKRSANNVAHYLVSYSSSLADRKRRKENIHPKFLSIFCNDLK
ncbi:hypothetical protein AgCh_000219 [Apium graveolens]